MMMSESKARELALPVLARIKAFASVGVDPALMGIARSMPRAAARSGRAGS